MSRHKDSAGLLEREQMKVETIEDARRIVLEKRPGMKVESEHEMRECFVINVVPIGYTKANGIFVGGSTRVDKETGKVSLFNPILESDTVKGSGRQR